VLILVKGLLLVGVELGKDEVAYWYWARHHLDASYAFVMFAIIRVFDVLLCGNDLLLRLPFVLGSVASAWLLNRACERAGLTTQDRLLAVLSFVSSHWAWHTGSFLHPDGVLIPIWLATLASAHRADRTKSDGDWVITGVLAGLTCLCKYTGCILAAGLVLALALRGRHGLRALFLAAVPCAVVSTPLLWALWDLDFHLPFTLGSLSQVAAEQPVIWRAALFIVAPLLYVSAPLLWLLYGGMGRAWRQRTQDGVDLLLVPALSLLATFAFFAIVNGQVKGNWVLPGFLGLWPLAFDNLHRRRFHRIWWVALLILGAGQTAVPAMTLRLPATAQWLVSASGTMVDATYPAIVSPTDLPREPTFSWTERVCEYHGWSEFGHDVSARLAQRNLSRVRLASGEYGVGYGLGRYMPDQPDVTIIDDQRFAHIADVGAQESTIYVTRRGNPLPPSVSQRQPTRLDRATRYDVGCEPVDYEIYLLPASYAVSAESNTQSRERKARLSESRPTRR
jgi:hypothetical protein